MVWRWHIPCMRPQHGGYGPLSDGWLNPAPFRQCQLASLVRSRDRYEYVWRRRETRLRGRSSAIKARSIVCLRGKRGDDGDQPSQRSPGHWETGSTGYVPVPLEAHRRTRTRATWVDRILPWCGTAGWPLQSGMVPDQAKAAHGQGRASAARLVIGPPGRQPRPLIRR